MISEEAKDFLITISYDLGNMAVEYLTEKDGEKMREAIKALEQQPCEDCISRQATVKRLCKVGDFMNEKRSGLGSPYIMAALFIQDNKDEFPHVTPTRPTGHWIEKEDCNLDIYYDCSECGESFCLIDGTPTDNLYNYCPNCGSAMTEE